MLEISPNNKFDLILFRGTFQYLDQFLHKSVEHVKQILKKNGKIVIFSLPSTDSLVYFLLKEKWALFNPEMSLMFNENSFRYLCDKYSLSIDDLDYPYLDDAYSNLDKDYKQLINIILGKSDASTPFWGALMRVVISN